jgi:hypothetical protein
MAILLAVLALGEILRAITLKGPTIGSVFLGMQSVMASSPALGAIIGVITLVYAAGVWRMKHYALALGWVYAAYSILGLTLAWVRIGPTEDPGEMVFAIVYTIGALTLSVGTSIVLTRRKAELS